MKTNTNVSTYLAQFFLERDMFQRKFVAEIKTHFVFSNYSLKIWFLWDNVEKYSTAGQVTDDNLAHAHFMLDY